MAKSSDSPLCPDWVFLNRSNVHVAKDRGWFKTYTPFTSTLNHSPFTSPLDHSPVLGIGTVEIPTKRSPNLSGVSSHGSLHLNEVLHVPGFLCNVIGNLIMFSDGYDVQTSFSPKSKGTIKDSQGKNMAYFDPNRPLFAIKVRGQPMGPKLGLHALKEEEGIVYMLGCHWDSTEQQKWREFEDKNGLTNPISGLAGAADETPPFMTDEKVYLKENWRDEYYFLLEYSLNIYKEEDRAEG
ncbi:hypothetical protein P154DRAFT_440960 [Amniculicola lignicola CBS 123094]|uniref:Uncharacterized protein n=1 Tax=Amniculicola lignicola CBS 123094 TaxID=1392246 RepID=A0A6A5WIK4_9PLEO|nr:hypothetical protein P154DRAFT_440960 [Amniculicola lignicola CBS 123094]